MSSILPKLVLTMTSAHDAWIVGSAADPNNNPRDYDVIVPYSQWQKACMIIPSDAKPNSFDGWKCQSEGFEIDIWTGDLAWIMKQSQSKYVWHISSNRRWKFIKDG